MNKEELSNNIVIKFTEIMEELILKFNLKTHGDLLNYILPECNNKSYIRKLMANLRHSYLILNKDLSNIENLEKEAKKFSKYDYVDNTQLLAIIIKKIAELNSNSDFMKKLWLKESYLKEEEPKKINFNSINLGVEKCLINK